MPHRGIDSSWHKVGEGTAGCCSDQGETVINAEHFFRQYRNISNSHKNQYYSSKQSSEDWDHKSFDGYQILLCEDMRYLASIDRTASTTLVRCGFPTGMRCQDLLIRLRKPENASLIGKWILINKIYSPSPSYEYHTNSLIGKGEARKFAFLSTTI